MIGKRIVLLSLIIVIGILVTVALGQSRGRYTPRDQLAYYAVDTASNDTYVAVVSGVSSYTTGLFILLNPATANTDAATLNINGMGAKAIEGQDGNALTTNDILSTGIYAMTYDGTNFLLIE